MFKFTLFLLTVYHVQCMPQASDQEAVNIDDDDAVQNDEEAQTNIRSIITAGMEKSDPLILKRIDANLATLNYTLTDLNITGIAKCNVKDAVINKTTLTLKIEWACPNFYFEGQYQTKGTILVLPLEGRGDFNVRMGKHNLIINANLEAFKDKIGRDHLKLKRFIIDSVNYIEPIKYQLNNLFNGDTKLADEALKFLNNNWKDVANVVEEPFCNAWIKQTLKNVNEYLKLEPVEKITN